MAAACKPTDLKYLLECCICLNSFQDPRVLPCLHSYCLECLESHVDSNKGSDGSFLCPQCREKVALPEEGVDGFPKNFFVNSMKDVLPASLLVQGPRPQADHSPSQPMCQHHGDDSGDEHGVAVIFCTQCDAHFCKTCAKHHRMFSITKDHEVSALSDKISEVDTKTNKKCALHDHAINWYCESCGLPACADCILENHQSHDLKKLSAVEIAFKEDMANVSVEAAKHLKYLREQLENLESNKVKMNEELDKTKTSISKTSDTLCQMIKDREQVLQGKVESFRDVATKQFDEATERLQTAITNTSTLISSSEALCEASSDETLETVIQAPTLKQKLLHQQKLHVPSVQLATDSSPLRCRHENMTTAGFLGTVSLTTSATQEVQQQNVFLQPPLKTIKLDYTGSKWVSGIALIQEHMVCVTHYVESFIWVYKKDGKLVEKIKLSCVGKISGMITVDSTQRKLAICDSSQMKIHFIQLSATLQIVQTVSIDMPFKCKRISISPERVILVINQEKKESLSMKPDGTILHKAQFHLPVGKVEFRSVVQSKRGIVFCDKNSKKVYFVDVKGNLNPGPAKHCRDPTCAVATFSDKVFVSDAQSNDVKVFTDSGTLLGNIQDKDNTVLRPHFLHVEEEANILYVACGGSGAFEIRLFSLKSSDLQPTVKDVTEVSVGIRLVDV